MFHGLQNNVDPAFRVSLIQSASFCVPKLTALESGVSGAVKHLTLSFYVDDGCTVIHSNL